MTNVSRIRPDCANIFTLSAGSAQVGMLITSIILKILAKLTNCSLIALMLGRLRMTTRDALRTYNKIAGSVFCKSNRKHSFQNEAFKATTLKKQIQNLVAEKALGEDILFEEDEAGATKIFVCTVSAINMAYPRLFRFYTVRENANTNCKI